MKKVSIRDLRQRWPETEKALEVEKEILITRDSKPVAKLVRYVKPERAGKRFDPVAHLRWQKKMSGGKTVRWVDALLAERDER
jgi:antitoxin (DNA-binding transcriptional repressor) of toxin-antitoxin stability system